MSQTATRVTVQSNLAGQARMYGNMFKVDLKHIPESEYASSKGGKAKSVQAIVAEVIGFNKMAAGILQGKGAGTMPSEEESAAFAKAFNTTAACQSALEESCEELAKAIEATSDEDLTKTQLAPWGMEMTYVDWASIATTHILYHDGQLNFIQSLNGDDQIHWMEG